MIMVELEAGNRAFSTFRVLNGDGNSSEREQLFRNVAQLFSFVADKCEDEQVVQYDDVLCQLADLVEVEARAHVARVLSGLERAPGKVVVLLANDVIEVARPLLEFSTVLSDDDLIEIVARQSEAHRSVIAGRPELPERVGEAILEFGEAASVVQLARNKGAELSTRAVGKLVARASGDDELATALRNCAGIDWRTLREGIDEVGGRVLDALPAGRSVDAEGAGHVRTMVYNRIRNKAGFSASEWKLAYNQVKALSDRHSLDHPALARFARFGYGHHAAAALTVLLQVSPEVVVKWLAGQDYVATTVALRALGLAPDLFESLVAVLPWRDLPDTADLQNLRQRFEALGEEEAGEIFELWRSHAFRRRSAWQTAGAA